ncbi:MAG: fused MFS/spermidine synthase [Pirellulales bacterium]
MLAIYRITVFLSAALLFMIQPMFARLVLPLLGGAPVVWNTCLAFFQTALLAGYAYAHLSTAWLGVRRQATMHCLLLLAGLAVLPVGLPDGWVAPPESQPVLWLLGLLAVSVGLPFFLISSTAPLVQKWFAEAGHRSSGDPYFLYAASNVGSLLGLASYPLVIEPNLRLGQQSWLWTAGYLLLAVLMAGCASFVFRRSPAAAASPVAQATQATEPADRVPSAAGLPLTTRRRLRWLALAAVPSSWLLGVTTYLTTDIAAVPLLWTIPLAAYLVSFILVFARRPPLPHAWMLRLLGPMIMLVAVSAVLSVGWQVLLVHVAAFFVGAIVCHGELARDRPDTSHLTEFYLWMSTGGVIGGVFTALLAPKLFPWTLEYPLALVLACLLVPAPAHESGATRGIKLAALSLVTLVVVLSSDSLLETDRPMHLGVALIAALPVVSLLYLIDRPKWFAAALAVPLLLDAIAAPFAGDVLLTGRSYFGVHRVMASSPFGETWHSLVHGTTIHGRQSRHPQRLCEPLTYYHRSGPLGQVFEMLQPADEVQRVAVVGLGTGSIAAYSDSSREFTFYEIDPAVKQLAETAEYFSFLADCGARYRVVLGDGRLKMAEAPDGSYRLIVLDAFSSDAIPIHLLTREALAMYLAKLSSEGIVLVHTSNRHVDLEGVLSALAREAGLAALVRRDLFLTDEERAEGKSTSVYVAIARKQSDLTGLANDPRWESTYHRPGTRPWTDDFSNLVGALDWW